MLPERPFKQGVYRRETTSAATWLICAIAGAFVLQFAADSSGMAASASLTGELSLSRQALASGRLWTPLTFWLLHSPENLFHVGVVLGGLFLLGRELIGCLGSQRFLGVFLGSLLAGAALWSLVNLRSGQALIGATAGLYGLMAVYALLFPNRQVGFLLFFFFPVTFRPKQLAAGLLVIDVLALLLVDVLDRPLPFTYAPSAHLGGMVAGWLYGRFFLEAAESLVPRRTGGRRGRAVSPALPGRSTDGPATARSCEPSRAEMRARVDRILDRINSHGFDALTPEERRILDEARDLLSRR